MIVANPTNESREFVVSGTKERGDKKYRDRVVAAPQLAHQ